MITCILAHLLDICKSHRYSGPKGGPISLTILNLLDNLKSPGYSGPMKHNSPGYFANLFNIHESTGYSWMSWIFGAYEARISWIFEAYEVLLSRHSVNLLDFQGLWSLNLLDIRGQWITNHPHICEYQGYSGQGLQSTNHLYICEHAHEVQISGISGASTNHLYIRAGQNFQGLNFQTPPRSLTKNMNVYRGWRFTTSPEAWRHPPKAILIEWWASSSLWGRGKTST